jgi:tetratricopeptide (TPR) repeat protein
VFSLDDALTVAAPFLDADSATRMAGPLELDEALTMAPARPRVASGDTGPLQVGQAFGPRYHIIKLLGIGGMGAVYQGWDSELGVAVAIKVIRPDVMADPATAAEVGRRFKRELLLARQVTHTNVVRIHDLGDIDGIKYITMSYVEGTDLATRLKREGKQSVPETLRIARSVVAGLVAAHAADVVHRDLKPANIMIGVDGEALIMDFGIALSTGDSTGSAAGGRGVPDTLRRTGTEYTATTSGAIVGTLEYMAPEQTTGQPVDQRADIYALGLILYDMLRGTRRAASNESAVAELQRRMLAPPPPLSASAPGIPAAVDALIARCVDPDPAKRFQTTADLAAELGRLDDDGVPVPVRRTVSVPLMVAVVVMLTGVFGGTWWYGRAPAVVTHDPVSVLIADLDNRTGDPGFDGTLEPMLKRALEVAGFITAYDRNRLGGLGVRRADQPERLDEAAATTLAANQGLGVILSGSIGRQGDGYRLSFKAVQTVSGADIETAEGTASNNAEVLEVASRLITRIRKALGDDTSEDAQQLRMGSLTTTSLDVVRLYAAALDASADNKFEEARQHASKAVALDPDFGIGYLLLAAASRNMGRLDDNSGYIKQALSHLDGMTERERYSTRGYASWVSGDYEECVKQYGELIAKYPGDVGGRNQLALCLSHLRQMGGAMDEMRAVVKILPKRVTFRVNLALYASYAGDFKTAEQEARAIEGPDAYATLALAFAQAGQGQWAQARDTYQRLAGIGTLGASFAASGLGDVAAFEGRYADAVGILARGAAADIAAESPDRAAAKFAAIAHAELSRGRSGAARNAAEESLRHGNAVKVRFLAGRTFVETGDLARVRSLITSLAGELSSEAQAYAGLLEGALAMKNGDPRQAMTLVREANTRFDSWIGKFDLGRAALEAGAFIQADSAFDECLKGRGESLSLFVDEEPTAAYLPSVYYYIGRVREELKTAKFAESYQQYLAIRGRSGDDRLVPDVRRRVKSG